MRESEKWEAVNGSQERGSSEAVLSSNWVQREEETMRGMSKKSALRIREREVSRVR